MGKNINTRSGESSFFKYLKNYALSDKKVKEYYEKNIINKDINNVMLKESDDGYVSYIEDKYPQIEKERTRYSEIFFQFWTPYLSSLGIRMFFVQEDECPRFLVKNCIFITDFHMIIFKTPKTRVFGINKKTIYEKPEDLLIIPLNKIKRLELVKWVEWDLNHEGYTYTKKNSPVKGAVIGGIVAGPTGAVIGAMANQGEKKINVPSYTTKLKIYDLIIEMKDNQTFEFEAIKIPEGRSSDGIEENKKLCQIKINEPQYSEEPIKMINEKLNFLLCRAKNNYNDEEMSNITNQTFEEGVKFMKKVEFFDKWSVWIGLAIVFIISLIYALLTS